MPDLYKAIKSYQPESRQNWIAGKGDIFKYERRQTTYSGWIWCTNKKGESAWVPEEWVKISEDTCRLIRDYNAIELDLKIGDMVSGVFEVGGWIWIVNTLGEFGWVPQDYLIRRKPT
jgi:hypothetical protein